ncbi:eukaryotic translation initiation factor 5B-like isoform X3 [Pecten maximus]|uniref:eukaryotic translation initiation factor 5B-like isoform X3 n=1 Tax=Pecten maximus TaxID=6579 RepID=UPI0014588C2C|nr:eukaryotic translation initiation factor 5B-like isoform X3 [Pecten maximus]
MGKPKNKGKKGQDEEFDDDIPDPVLNSEKANEENVKPATKSAGKKKSRRKKDDDDWEDDVAAELAALSMENKVDGVNGEEQEEEPVYAPKKKDKKKNKAKVDEDDALEEEIIEEETEVQNSTSKKKSNMSAFQLLMEDDDGDDSGSDKNDNDDDDDDEKEEIIEAKPKVESNKSKSKSKKDKKKEQKDEDIDAILADLEKPKASKKSKKKKGGDVEEEEGEKAANNDLPTEEELEAKMQAKVVTMEDLEEEDEDDRKKRKKKGKKKDTKEEEEGDKMDEDEEGEEAEEGSTVKTNAQKRKEKREREKLKKQQDKKKQKAKPSEEAASTVVEAESTEGAAAAEDAEGEKKDDEDEKKDEKEGKKKKKKGEKEEKKKKPRAPVAAIKAQLEMIRLEEERIRKEEEEREKREEEERLRKEEEKRLEEERKQRKKQKEKEKKERLKQEGKLLTGKQKQDRQRAMQMLEEMKARGIDVPNKDEIVKKRPVYSNRKKNQKQQHQQTEDTPSPVEEVSPTASMDEKTPEPETKTEEKPKEDADDVADAWDAEDDTKDEWDAEDKEEEKEEEKEVEKTVEPPVEEEKEEEAEESEEESEEEDDEEDEEEESSSEEEESEDDDLTPIERAKERIMKRREEAEKNRTTDTLRSPVVCVLGHVDTGKTKILDKLRKTNVQDGEAGGITQQIGATNVPEHAIKDQTKMCKEFSKKELKLPGLLIIDTPGHESFSNLRSRGSSLCDIAILVVDIMHALEPQTIESINLLKQRKTPFVIALNKVDRLYQWKPMPQTDIVNVIKKQNPQTKGEFDKRAREVITQMAEQGLNSALFYENKNPKEYISLVPTSAHSGDGMGNLIALLCELSQTMLAKRLSYCSELQATVMEVKALHGLGTTIDVILVNGKLKEGNLIVVPGTEGPIVTQVRGLLMPQPMRELRVKSQWEHHKEVLAAQGVKVIAKDMEKAIAGLPLYVARNQDETEYYKEELSVALREVLNAIKLSERGVFVQASTLGSLEALLEFLKVSNIPYAGINIGPVHRKDIMKASIMLEHDTQYAVILAFDVRVEREAQEMADSLGVTIFTADIIYNLFDKFIAYRNAIKKKNQDLYRHIAVFPCKVRILPQYIFNSRDPIVCGVIIEDGFLKEGTPLCVPSKEFLDIGRVTSLEANHKHLDIARKGMEVCIKVEPIPGDTPKMIGRHFDETDMLVSKISRNSIDAVKNYFREDMLKQDWQLMVELKKKFEIL